MTQQINDQTRDQLRTAHGVLIRSMAIAFGILLFWFIGFLAGSDYAYRFCLDILNISMNEYILLNIGGMVVFKTLGITLFLIPWLSIRLFLHKTG